MTEQRRVTACLLIIGDEILSGRTRDANLSYLAKWLNGEGVELREARVIPDDAEVIIRTVNEVRAAYDYVFTTGGIGPTHDDITTDCVAAAFGVPLHFNEEAAKQLMARLTGPMTEGRRRMTRIPEGATIIRNPLSGAPGFRLGNVHVLAGIPAVTEAMLETLRGTLSGGRPVRSETLHVFAGESVIAATLLGVQEQFPDVSIGSYPFGHQDRYGANLVLRSPDETRLGEATEALRQALERNGFAPAAGEATPTPEDLV